MRVTMLLAMRNTGVVGFMRGDGHGIIGSEAYAYSCNGKSYIICAS